MAIQHMTYLDIPATQRSEAAKVARQKIQGMLTNPFMEQDQVVFLHARLTQLDMWEQGLLPTPPSAAAPRQLAEAIPDAEWEDVEVDMPSSEHHEVALHESVDLDEKAR